MPIGVYAEQALANLGVRRRICRGKADRAAALGAQQYDAARIGVGKRLRERRQIGLGPQRAGDEQQLDIRDWLARAALYKARDAARQIGGKAFTEEIALGE